MSSRLRLPACSFEVPEWDDPDVFACVVPTHSSLSRDECQFIEMWVDLGHAGQAARAVWGPGIDGKRVLANIMARPAARLYAHDLRSFYYRRVFSTKEDIIVEIEAMLAAPDTKGKLRVRLLELLTKILVPKFKVTATTVRDSTGRVVQRGLTMEEISRFRHDMLGIDRRLVGAQAITAGASRTGHEIPIDLEIAERDESEDE